MVTSTLEKEKTNKKLDPRVERLLQLILEAQRLHQTTALDGRDMTPAQDMA